MKLKFLFILLFISTIFSCKKETTTPEIETNTTTDVTQKSFVTGYTIVSDGGENITESGICWSLTSSPDINDNKVKSESNSNKFSCILKDLNPETKYYVRAYAINKKGVGYGQIL